MEKTLEKKIEKETMKLDKMKKTIEAQVGVIEHLKKMLLDYRKWILAIEDEE